MRTNTNTKSYMYLLLFTIIIFILDYDPFDKNTRVRTRTYQFTPGIHALSSRAESPTSADAIGERVNNGSLEKKIVRGDYENDAVRTAGVVATARLRR